MLANTHDFRDCVAEAAYNLIHLNIIVCPPEARLYMYIAIRTFSTSESQTQDRKLLLAMLPESDWGNHDRIDIWLDTLDVIDVKPYKRDPARCCNFGTDASGTRDMKQHVRLVCAPPFMGSTCMGCVCIEHE